MMFIARPCQVPSYTIIVALLTCSWYVHSILLKGPNCSGYPSIAEAAPRPASHAIGMVLIFQRNIYVVNINKRAVNSLIVR